jgi:hypothetical protein
MDEELILSEAKPIIVGAFPIYRSLAPLPNSLAETLLSCGVDRSLLQQCERAISLPIALADRPIG